MAKRTRSKKASFDFLSKPFIAGLLVVFAIVGLIYFSMNRPDVKGANTFQPPSAINHPIQVGSTSANKCNSRLTAFSASGNCSTSNSSEGNEQRDSFSSFTYTCSNGTGGTVSGCSSLSSAFVKANIACAKAAGCNVPSPKPSTTSTPNVFFHPTNQGSNTSH